MNSPGSFEKIYMEVLPATLRTSNPISSNAFSIRRIPYPSYEFYREWHDRVGRQWDWHLRPRINDRAGIERELAHPVTELYVFSKEGHDIGYSLIVGDHIDEVELSDFGFAPEHLGKGYGTAVLPELLLKVFARGTKRIWLSTRSTNDPRVPEFYRRLGFTEYKREMAG